MAFMRLGVISICCATSLMALDVLIPRRRIADTMSLTYPTMVSTPSAEMKSVVLVIVAFLLFKLRIVIEQKKSRWPASRDDGHLQVQRGGTVAFPAQSPPRRKGKAD